MRRILQFLEVCISWFSPWKLGQMRLAITVLDSAHQEDCCKLWEFTRTGASCRHSHSVMAVIVEEASYCFFWILNFQMIDLTDIFNLCCFHNVKNNSLYECLWKYQSSKSFWGYICSNEQEKNGIEIGSTVRYSNLIFQKNVYYSFYKIRPNTESSIIFSDQLFERKNSSNYSF